MKQRFLDALGWTAAASVGVVLLLALVTATGGCTAESTRIALAAQRRADEVQQALFDRQQAGLRAMLFRDTLSRMATDDAPLTQAQRTALNVAWNERDLLEFWAVQFERSKALRMIGVDAKLFASQSPVDLLMKGLDTRLRRIESGLAAHAAEQAAARVYPPGAERVGEPSQPGPGLPPQQSSLNAQPRQAPADHPPPRSGDAPASGDLPPPAGDVEVTP